MLVGSSRISGRLVNYLTQGNACAGPGGDIGSLPETPKSKFQIPNKLKAPNFKLRHASLTVFGNWWFVIGDSLVVGAWDLVLTRLLLTSRRACTENRRAHTHECCTFFNRDPVILSHAH